VFGTQSAVAVIFTPYLIGWLGIGVFGLIPLANALASYASVFTVSIQGSVGRFLTIAVRRGDEREAEEVFNTAFWVTLALVVVLIPILGTLSYFGPALFHVPKGMDDAVRWFFAVSFAAYLVDVLRGIFMTAGVSANRLDLQNIAPLAEIVIRPALTVLMFLTGTVSVVVVAWGWFVGAVCALSIGIIVWRRLAPGMAIRVSAFSRSGLVRMWGTSAWMMVSQAGTLLFLAVDMVIANVVLGAEVAGAYGAVLVWSTFLRGTATAASSVVTPVALAAHAVGDEKHMTQLMRGSVRLMGLAVGLPVFLVAGLSRDILLLWLGPQFVRMAPVLIVLVGHLVVNLSVLPLFGLQLAKNTVKVPGIVTLAAGITNVSLALWLAGRLPDGLGIAMAGAIVLTLKNALFTPFYAARVQGVPLLTYFRELPVPLMLTAAFGSLAYGASVMGASSTILGVLLVSLGLGVSYALVGWRVLGAQERRFVTEVLPWIRPAGTT
jgi:membrane protein EpsK